METKSKGNRHIKCNKCGYVGNEKEFPKDRDFFQNPFISGCPKCDNRQNPGGASVRMFPGTRHPFTYVDRVSPDENSVLGTVLYDSEEAS